MKKVLITGANSYIGKNFRNMAEKISLININVDIPCSVRNDEWKTT